MKDVKLSVTTVADVIKRIYALLSEDPKAKFRLTLTKWRNKRSISMHSQQHLFYAQIAKHYGDRTPLEVKCQCKDMFGLPILHNSDHSGDQIEYLTHGLQYYKGNHERLLKLIQRFSVTSVVNTAESIEYCD